MSRALVVSVWIVFGAGSLEAQSIRGRVVLQGTDEPVPAAVVALLDSDLNSIERARTDGAGAFLFRQLRSGRYFVQADRDGVHSAVSIAVELGREDASLVLEIPSPLFVLAMTCGPAKAGRVSVLVGTVHDLTSDIALPGAGIELTWESGRLEVEADAAGDFRFCDVPTGRDLSLRASAWGREGVYPIWLADAPVNRINVPLELGALQFAVVVVGRQPADGVRSSLTFTLRDATTGLPLSGAAVWFGSSGFASYANASGVVRIRDMTSGAHDLRVEMVGYGSRSMRVLIPEGEDLRLDVRVPPAPVALEPISVHSHMRSEFRTPREANTRVDIIAGAKMQAAEDRGAQMLDLLRASFPGVLVTEGRYSTLDQPDIQFIVCVESIRRLDRLRFPDGVEEPFCDMVAVIYDGVPTYNPGELLRNMSVRELESVEFLNPLDAGIRYGDRAAQTGALVLWSRTRGPHRSPARHNH